jgi:hypothetical protein
MSLLTDLKSLVANFVSTQISSAEVPANILFQSLDFEGLMRDAASQGKKFTRFPLQYDLISTYLTSTNPAYEINKIEDNLIQKLETAYPGIKFYKNKYGTLEIYAQWEEIKQSQPGPVIG